jgi:hypothetical protein
MANNRTKEIIYSRIEPISDALKQKCATAFQEVVDKIKEKHLS